VAARQKLHIDVVKVPVGETEPGNIVDLFASAITPETRVLSVSHILSSTGLRMPIAELSALARSRDILCVVDGAQSAGAIPVDLKALGCHAYATSGHKWMLGPKGTGLLYLSEELGDQIEPMQFSDGRSYYNHSSGVGNIPGVIGLGVAIQSLEMTGMDAIERHNLALRNRFHDGLQDISSVSVVNARTGPLTGPMVTFELPAGIVPREFQLMLLERHGVVVKSLPRWLNGIRLSTHIFNTEAEGDAVLEVLRAELA
jgi:selenocysteine lyase/cysteine desulfurase